MSTQDNPEMMQDNEPMSTAETIANEAAAELDALRRQLEEAETKREEHFQLALRTQAEMENVRRRAERDIQQARAFALEKFVDELIPVMDSLEHALKASHGSAEAKAIYEGVELTARMFLAALEKFGVAPIDPEGQAFDPQLHEAMAMVEHPEAEPHTVINVFQRGYQLNGRLVRPARVVVARGPASSVNEQA